MAKWLGVTVAVLAVLVGIGQGYEGINALLASRRTPAAAAPAATAGSGDLAARLVARGRLGPEAKDPGIAETLGPFLVVGSSNQATFYRWQQDGFRKLAAVQDAGAGRLQNAFIGDFDGDGKNETIFVLPTSDGKVKYDVYRYASTGDAQHLYSVTGQSVPGLAPARFAVDHKEVLLGATGTDGLKVLLYTWDPKAGPKLWGSYPIADQQERPPHWVASGVLQAGTSVLVSYGGLQPSVDLGRVSTSSAKLAGGFRLDGQGSFAIAVGGFTGKRMSCWPSTRRGITWSTASSPAARQRLTATNCKPPPGHLQAEATKCEAGAARATPGGPVFSSLRHLAQALAHAHRAAAGQCHFMMKSKQGGEAGGETS